MRRTDITEDAWAGAKAELLAAMRDSARAGSLPCYSELAPRVTTFSLSHRSRHLSDMFDEIADEHLVLAGCLVTAVVVRKSKYRAQPGRRFFALAARHRMYSAGSDESPGVFARRQQEGALQYLLRP